MLFFADSGERAVVQGMLMGSVVVGDRRAAAVAQRARQPVPPGRGRAGTGRDGALAADRSTRPSARSRRRCSSHVTQSGRRRRDERRRGAQLGRARRDGPAGGRDRRDGVERLPVDPLERRAGEGGRTRERAAHRLGEGRRPGEHARPRSTSPRSRSGSTRTPRSRRELADFYFKRFRREFRPAVDAWVATRPLKNPQRAPDPVRDAAVQARGPRRGRASSRRRRRLYAAQARRNIQRASNYVLGVVLFASALFFAGMSTKLTSPRLRVVMLVHRLRRLPRHRRLDRDLARQPLRLTAGARARRRPAPRRRARPRRAAGELTRSCHLRLRPPHLPWRAAMLECDFCGCYSPEPGKGWAAVRRYDPEGVDGLCVAVYCPPCAAAEFGHRPDVAARYVCLFEPPDPNLPTSP